MLTVLIQKTLDHLLKLLESKANTHALHAVKKTKHTGYYSCSERPRLRPVAKLMSMSSDLYPPKLPFSGKQINMVQSDDLPSGAVYAGTYNTVTVDVSRYLTVLISQFEHVGGRMIRGSV